VLRPRAVVPRTGVCLGIFFIPTPAMARAHANPATFDNVSGCDAAPQILHLATAPAKLRRGDQFVSPFGLNHFIAQVHRYAVAGWPICPGNIMWPSRGKYVSLTS